MKVLLLAILLVSCNKPKPKEVTGHITCSVFPDGVPAQYHTICKFEVEQNSYCYLSLGDSWASANCDEEKVSK